MPKVSVVIPTYNRADLLDRAGRSVLGQSYQDLELIIVDDCSNDHTENIVRGWNDKRVRYLKLDQNGGAANARNVGAANASGDWIAFHDSDDIWFFDKIRIQMEYAELHPEYDLIYCGYRGIRTDGKCTSTPSRKWKQPLEGQMFEGLLGRNTIGAPTIIVKRNCFLEEGGFDINYRCLEDWEFAIRFAKNHLIGFVNQDLVDAYLSNSGVSSQLGHYFEAKCRMLGQYIDDYQKCGQFERTAAELFEKAEQCAALDQVKNRLMYYVTYFHQNSQ